ncbi:hypothetical protein [Streptomyces mirabilis]
MISVKGYRNVGLCHLRPDLLLNLTDLGIRGRARSVNTPCRNIGL